MFKIGREELFMSNCVSRASVQSWPLRSLSRNSRRKGKLRDREQRGPRTGENDMLPSDKHNNYPYLLKTGTLFNAIPGI